MNKKLLLILTVLFLILTPYVFELADIERGYDSTGGEIVFPFLPLIIWFWTRKEENNVEM